MIREALSNPDSPNRYLFMTGTRGCGKTSLLHQFADIAREDRTWTVLETTYHDCVEVLGEFAEVATRTHDPVAFRPVATVAGVSVSAIDVNREKEGAPTSHLAQPLVKKLSHKGQCRRLLLIIDEAQLVTEKDMEEVCHAVQAARTAGADIALIIAGLPSAFAQIRRYPGCTFVQRMRRLSLGMLSITDTLQLLESMFALVPELDVTQESLKEMGAFSSGHPYLLQLVGNYLYEIADIYHLPHTGMRIPVTQDLVFEAERRALEDYQANVARNLLVGLKEGTRQYLRRACDLSDDECLVSSAAVAASLGKTQKQYSPTRARLVDLQLLLPAGRGKLRLALPYLPLAFSSTQGDPHEDPSDMWVPRKNPLA